MTHTARALRVRRGALALTAAALVGGGLVAPVSSPAVAAAVEVPGDSLITTGTTWHYLDNNTDPAAGTGDRHSWTAPGFDDSSWKSAPGGFGAKNNQLESVGGFVPATQLEHYIDGSGRPTVPTYFFRTSFELETGVAEQLEAASSTVTYDDALRVFVNGKLVQGFVDERVDDTLDTNLQYAGAGNGSPLTSTFTIDGDVLQDGTNTVAIALYQDRESSSDIYFDMSELKLEKTLAPGEVVPAAPTRVILTPTETPAISQSFSWRAGHPSHDEGQVEIGLAAGGATRVLGATAVGTVLGNQHQHFSVTVDGLTAATDYRYRVGHPGSMSEWFTFSTENPNETDFQFIYYGDAQIGLDTTWPNVVKQAEARATNSIGSVHAGDLIDTSSNDTQWQNWFAGMERSATSTNVMAAPGNHEYSGDALMTSWKAHFEYPLNQPSTDTIGELAQLAQGNTPVAKQYAAYFEHWAKFAEETVYFVDYQNVRFITLNATRNSTFLKPSVLPECSGAECPSDRVADLWTEYQAAWLDFVLKHSPSKWNVVTFHQPVYSTSSGRDEKVLRDHWVPVFEANDIDLVLMGHDHTYARGYNNADTTEVPGLTTGPVYAVSNSGAKHYNLESEEKNVWTNNGATQVLRGERVVTYQVIDVSADQLVYRSYLADKTNAAKSFTLDTAASADRPVYLAKDVPNVGDLYDEVTVTKYDTGDKWVTEAGVPVPAAPAVTVDAAEVRQGDSVTFSGTGFTPGAELKLELHSVPVSLGTAVVAADGAFSQVVTIPADTATDVAHSLVAVLPNGAAVSATLTVLPAVTEPGGTAGGGSGATDPGVTDPGPVAPGMGATDGTGSSLANTGSLSHLPFVAGGAALLLAGALVVLFRGRARAGRPVHEFTE